MCGLMRTWSMTDAAVYDSRWFPDLLEAEDMAGGCRQTGVSDQAEHSGAARRGLKDH
jgi:hypothetical protein